MGLGYAATRRGWVASDNVRALGRFVLLFCVPAMLVRTLAHTPLSQALDPRFLAPYALGSLLAMGLVMAVSRLALKRAQALGALQGLGAAGSNSLFIGLPIVQPLVGAQAALALAMVQLVENALVIPLGLALADAQGRHGWRAALRHTVRGLARNPLVLGIGAGLALSALELPLPAPLDKAMGLLAGAAAPTALFVVGGSLAGLKLRGLAADLALVAGGKLLLHPLCVAAALWMWTPATPALRLAGVLFAAVPMMSIYPTLGLRHHQESFCAGALLAATLASLVTLHAWMAVLVL